MTESTGLNWGMTLDLTAIVMWGVLVIYLAGQRIKHGRMLPMGGPGHGSQDFHRLATPQQLRHQTEKSLNAVAEALEKERKRLHRAVENEAPLNPCSTAAPRRPEVAASPTRERAPRLELPGSNKPGRLYDRIPRLAVEGMSAEMISRRIGRPVAEVELVLKCASRHSETEAVAQTAQANFAGP